MTDDILQTEFVQWLGRRKIVLDQYIAQSLVGVLVQGILTTEAKESRIPNSSGKIAASSAVWHAVAR